MWAALTQPLVLAHATGAVPPERRGWAIGVLASAGTSCRMIGPLLGGVLAETAGWRWVFLINLPVVPVALGLGARFMSDSREQDARSRSTSAVWRCARSQRPPEGSGR